MKEMATVRKGKGTTVRRQTKSTSKAAAVSTHETNGKPALDGTAQVAPNTEMNIETIRARAYELFLARGGMHGNDLADWFIAERELRGVQKP